MALPCLSARLAYDPLVCIVFFDRARTSLLGCAWPEQGELYSGAQNLSSNFVRKCRVKVFACSVPYMAAFTRRMEGRPLRKVAVQVDSLHAGLT